MMSHTLTPPVGFRASLVILTVVFRLSLRFHPRKHPILCRLMQIELFYPVYSWR